MSAKEERKSLAELKVFKDEYDELHLLGVRVFESKCEARCLKGMF